MPVSNVVQLGTGARQFRSVFYTVVEFEAKYNPVSVGSNSTTADEISIAGVELGDFCLANIDVDIQDLTTTVHVTAPGVITITLANTTAGAVDLVESNLHVVVLRPHHRHS
jgi:hypothetical protein